MDFVRFSTAVFVASLSFLGLAPAMANDSPTTRTAVLVTRPAAEAAALEFLGRMEQKHAATKTLTAEFDQVRVDFTFDETVRSSGRFWYRSPSSYYAEYEAAHPSRVWSDERRLVEYIPSLRQVDVIPVDQGDDAPVTQMLLGFGIKVDRITRLFDVRTLDSAERGQVRIEFTSKDLDRTFNFSRIVVSFDERQLEPRVIEMEDNMGTRTITLRRVRINPTIRDSVFEIPRFSADELDINGAEHL